MSTAVIAWLLCCAGFVAGWVATAEYRRYHRKRHTPSKNHPANNRWKPPEDRSPR